MKVSLVKTNEELKKELLAYEVELHDKVLPFLRRFSSFLDANEKRLKDIIHYLNIVRPIGLSVDDKDTIDDIKVNMKEIYFALVDLHRFVKIQLEYPQLLEFHIK